MDWGLIIIGKDRPNPVQITVEMNPIQVAQVLRALHLASLLMIESKHAYNMCMHMCIYICMIWIGLELPGNMHSYPYIIHTSSMSFRSHLLAAPVGPSPASWLRWRPPGAWNIFESTKSKKKKHHLEHIKKSSICLTFFFGSMWVICI